MYFIAGEAGEYSRLSVYLSILDRNPYCASFAVSDSGFTSCRIRTWTQ